MHRLVVISGRSGAGKSTVARALEDLGYFVVDNLPPQLLSDLLLIKQKDQKNKKNIGLVIDVRDTENLKLLPEIWSKIDINIYKKDLIFVDASEQKLIERFQETKRRHPLDINCGIRKALDKEKEILIKIKNLSTKNIWTDKYTSYELKNYIQKEIGVRNKNLLSLNLLSFGFKYGVPGELDLCFDVRFLKNPFYELELRSLSGLDKPVQKFVISDESAQAFLVRIQDILKFLLPLYKKEGKSSLTIAFGCTGGQHRSVAIAESLKFFSQSLVNSVRVEHRELFKK